MFNLYFDIASNWNFVNDNLVHVFKNYIYSKNDFLFENRHNILIACKRLHDNDDDDDKRINVIVKIKDIFVYFYLDSFANLYCYDKIISKNHQCNCFCKVKESNY